MASGPHLTWAICICMAATAAGHGMMVTPRPRAGTRNAGNNKGRGTAPCGRGGQLQTAGSPVATYEPGQKVDVRWRIDAAHGGTCKISLSTSGGGVPSGFEDLTGTFPCARRGQPNNREVTIPQGASCENCVLQWYWRGDADYYNCMDISIKKAGPPPTPPPPPPTPAPQPMPPRKTDEPWSLWKDGHCLVVKNNHIKGQRSMDAELVTPGKKEGWVDAEHDGKPCSAFHAHSLPDDLSVFRLCECKAHKGMSAAHHECMCANWALTWIPPCDSESPGSWEVRLEDASHQNKNQTFHQKNDGSNCVSSDDTNTKCFKVAAWKAPKTAPAPAPARRRRRGSKKGGPTRRRRKGGPARRRRATESLAETKKSHSKKSKKNSKKKNRKNKKSNKNIH